MRVGLVFGGKTTEGNVSILSAENVRAALQKLGHEIVNIEYNKNISMHIQDANIDVVFNAMHGQYGEDGCLQGLLNIMQIPYTHSGVFGSALGMNKIVCNVLFKNLGIKEIRGFVVQKQNLYDNSWKEIFKNSEIKDCKEIFIKPACDGSSRDTFLVKNIDEFSFNEKRISTASKKFLVEERIIGKEVQVAVINDKPVGLLEVVPNKEKSEFYDYTAKYSENGAIHRKLEESDDIKNKLLSYAEKIHNALGLNCISRSEFLLTEDKEIYALEVNTHPGLTSLSIVPDIAMNAGISYEQIIDFLLKSAKYES